MGEENAGGLRFRKLPKRVERLLKTLKEKTPEEVWADLSRIFDEVVDEAVKSKEKAEREAEIKNRALQTLQRIIGELSKPESLRKYTKEELDSDLPKMIEGIIEQKVRSRIDAEIIWDRANRSMPNMESEKSPPT